MGSPPAAHDGDETTAREATNGRRRRAPRTLVVPHAQGRGTRIPSGCAPGAMPNLAGPSPASRRTWRRCAFHRPTRGDCEARGSSRMPSSRSAARGRPGSPTSPCLRPRKAPSAAWRTRRARTSSARPGPSQASALHRPGRSGARGWPRFRAARRQRARSRSSASLAWGTRAPGPSPATVAGARAIYERTTGTARSAVNDPCQHAAEKGAGGFEPPTSRV